MKTILPFATLPKWGNLLPIALLPLVLTGCGTSSGLLKAQQNYRQGEFRAAASGMARAAGRVQPKAKDAVILKLEAGSMALAAGNRAGAERFLVEADQAIEYSRQRPVVALGSEAAALVSNLNSMPYVPSPCDSIMGASYLALTFAEAGQIEKARSAVKLAKNRQSDVLAKFERQIQKEQSSLETANELKAGVDFGKARIPEVVEKLSAPVSKYPVLSNYTVSYAELMNGLILGAGANPEVGRAQESFQRALASCPGNGQLRRGASGAVAGRLHVLYESGVGPSLGSFRMDIPLKIKNSVSVLSMAFPTFETHEAGGFRSVKAGGVNVKPELVCDFDRIGAAEFKRRLPGIVTRTVVASGVKTAVSIAGQEVIRQKNGTAADVFAVASSIYNVASASADRRIWATLPKQAGYASLPVPADGKVDVGGYSIKVPTSGTVIVRVREVAGKFNHQVVALN